ncbi:MAG: DUF3574 domain-containing protein [Blastocatellia bacterium]
MMMHTLPKKQLFAFALLAASLLAPAAYAQQQPTLSAAPPAALRSDAGHQEQAAAKPFLRTELFFGADKPDGSEIGKEEFRRFLKEEITPRFPDGLTVLTGTGQFRDSESDKIIREKSMVLILLYPLGTWKESNEKIEQIRRAYKERFKQQSVLRVDDPRPVLVSL